MFLNFLSQLFVFFIHWKVFFFILDTDLISLWLFSSISHDLWLLVVPSVPLNISLIFYLVSLLLLLTAILIHFQPFISKSMSSLFVSFCFCLRQSLSLSSKLEYSGVISVNCNIHFLGSRDSPSSASWVAGITGLHHHAQLIFVFLVDGFLPCWPAWSWTPGLSWSACLSLPNCWDFSYEPPLLTLLPYL